MFTNKVVFFDFDGVIKESNEVKSEAFINLFANSENNLTKRILDHHLSNIGMSRYEKIPIYLEWSGLATNIKLIEEYEKKFSQIVKEGVINSKWVPGVQKFLSKKKNEQLFFLVTATPQSEIEEILNTINIRIFFDDVVGSPMKKSKAIKILLSTYSINSSNSVMIGDSKTDYEAAVYNSVPFILRRTSININLQNSLNCRMIDDFLYE
tara:strand:- start:67 stop:693 length:627 start_codon:yes stop_codon:yes gene_type:complete